MIYAAHILDPRCKSSMITMMMGDKAGAILTAVKKYFRTEWPQTDAARTPTASPSLSLPLPGPRPSNISIARWKALQQQHEQHAEVSIAPLLSELDEWLHSKPEEWNSSDSPDYVLLWWKEHQLQWPHLAAAARDLLLCSASEVDVERLFSGCRDEYGIRRHSLKAETVRVLVLLRSAYETEDDIDKELIKAAMAHDIIPQKNSILWRPDNFNGRVTEDTVMTDPTTEPPLVSSKNSTPIATPTATPPA